MNLTIKEIKKSVDKYLKEMEHNENKINKSYKYSVR